MYSRLTALVLHWLRVPPEPHPPHGDPASLRVFRAGKNHFNLRLAGWFFAQLAALAGIIFWLVMFLEIESVIRERHLTNQSRINPREVRDFDEYIEKIGAAQKAEPNPTVAPAAPDSPAGKPAAAPKSKAKSRVRINGWAGFKLMLLQVGLWLPPWAFPLVWVLKGLGILLYLAQLPVTYAVRRLEYEMRWYMVTDRSLRIRHGVWKVNESTMSFANIQQVVVSQGPLQRLLGLADVKVQSAGGGGGGPAHQRDEDDMHLGLFHSVTNAPEIRDLIQDRLRRFRESGLGDPEEAGRRVPPVSHGLGEGWSPPERGAESAPYPLAPASPDLLAAARELAAEAQALRASLG